MAHFLFANIPEKNHLYPMIPVMMKLLEGSHRVSVATHSSLLEQLPEKLHRIDVDGYSEDKVSPYQEEFEDLFSALVEMAPVMAERYLQIYRQENPDHIITGSLDFSAAIAAEASGIRWSVIGTNPGMLEVPGSLPYTGRGLDSKSLKSRVAGYFHKRMTTSFATPFNKARESLGLPSLENPLVRQMHQATQYFAVTMPELEPGTPEFSDSVHFAGPILWQPREFPEEQLSKRDLTPPVIVVQVSQIDAPDNHVVVRRLVDGLAEKNCTVIIETLGEDYEISEFPSNFSIQHTIDLVSLVPRVHVLIHRGNYLGYAAGIQYGIPAIVLQTGAEGRENAVRAKLAGIAEIMDVDDFRAKHLNDLITKLINEPLYRMMAERLKDELRNQDSAGAIAEVLLEEV